MRIGDFTGSSSSALLLAAALSAALLGACGGDSSDAVADLGEEMSGGGGEPFIAAAAGFVVPEGYVSTELVAQGTATDYRGARTSDGLFDFSPDTKAAYRTRVLVRRPADPEAMSGTVIVEWLNVSSGADADPVYTNLAEEITRQGHVWVGVSAQRAGVEGGGEALLDTEGALSLVDADPARYGSLEHPGDGYSFDIFTQVARALRRGEGLGGESPSVIIAAGQSQSAFALTTYYDGVQPLTGAFDAFFVQSRAAGALPLVPPGEAAMLTSVILSTMRPVFRGDLDAPVMSLQAENNVDGILASRHVRQPDTERFRLWEVAGTAHADAFIVGDMADAFDCGAPVNDGPMHLVAKAALRALDAWARTGDAPPTADRLELQDGSIVRDEDGIALGGIRTPPVDVPVDVLSGEPGPAGGTTCILFGSTLPLSGERIGELYGSRDDYETRFEDSADATIEAGFVLEDDRDALLGYAQPERVDP